jgi:hypothetical protein
MFVHPKCPCSAASLDELAELMANCRSGLTAFVVMFQPDMPGEDWTHTAAWSAAGNIPGVEVRPDSRGDLAKKYGAKTSGQVLLYDRNGKLLFAGGITGSRGHVGDNDGLATVTKLVLGKLPAPATPARSPVFGCAIYTSGDAAADGQTTGVRE